MRLKFGLLFLLLSSTLFSQNMFGIAVGYCHLARPQSSPQNKSTPGVFTAALLVPVRLPVVDAHFKSKVAMSLSKNEFYDYDRYFEEFFMYDRLAVLSNTFMFGKRILTDAEWSVLPQVGFGGRAEIIYDDWKWGDAKLDVLIDFSLWIERRFDYANIGVLTNFELDRLGESASVLSGKRFSFALVVSK